MTDVYAARYLLPAVLLVYAAPVLFVYGGYCTSDDSLWAVVHCTLPVAVYLGSMLFKTLSGVPDIVDVVFSNVDLPYQQRFLMVFAGAAFIAHLIMLQQYDSMLLQQGMAAFSVPSVGSLVTVSVAATLWCLHLTYEVRRLRATNHSLLFSWISVLAGTVAAGPAATLATVFGWSRTTITRATS